MGEVVGAALVAHVPTIMLPEETRLELNEGREITLVPGLRRMKEECLDRLRPDTVIVFDTHWESTFEHIVTAQDRRQGKFTSHELPRGMRQIPYDMPGDPQLAKLIAAQAEDRDDCWILASDDPYLPIFYGTVNIWTFLGDANTAWLSVALNQTCDTGDFLLFGELIGDAIAQSDRRVVLLASGGMTHRFFNFKELRTRESQRAPDNIYDRRYYDADMEVLAKLESGDHAGVIDGMPEYRKAYPEGHFGHYLMMAAAIGGRDCVARGERFSEYEASVGTGQVHVWFERPAGGWTG
ncbi:MAG TPA: catechol 1,2-dioxygenase [Actinomycetota bacterium]|nr:catechol 1,2-dioxygenase [Actinomycetota bacterium]